MWIEDFQHNIIQRRYVIDDRGFISALEHILRRVKVNETLLLNQRRRNI